MKKKSLISIIFAVILSVFLFINCKSDEDGDKSLGKVSFALAGYNIEDSSASVLAEGVVQTNYELVHKTLHTSDNKPWKQKLYIIDVDPSQNSDLTLYVGIRPDVTEDYIRGLSTTRTAADWIDKNISGYYVIAGINGDFFNTNSSYGGPYGYSMHDGQWLTTGMYYETDISVTNDCKYPGWAFGITSDNVPVIVQPVISIELDSTATGGSIVDFPVNAINQLRSDMASSTYIAPDSAVITKNKLVLYTADYDDTAPLLSGGINVTFSLRSGDVTSNGTIIGEVTAITSIANPPIKSGYMILSAKSGTTAYAELGKFAIGDDLSITINVDAATSNLTQVIGGGRHDGGPLLVDNGEVLSLKTGIRDYSSNGGTWDLKNPRTAIGVRTNGTYFFFVVDGRQANVSEGVTITELSKIAVCLGADRSVNIDGGGSSTMIIKGDTSGSSILINSPAYSFEREDGNHLFVVAK